MRSCESCGSKMPFGVRRQKVEGQLVCDGCLNGRPGMPRTQITRRTAGVFDAVTSVQGQSVESLVGAFPLKHGNCYVLELAPTAGHRRVVAMLNGTVVMGQLDWDPDGKIGQLYVEPRFRRAGVATALLAAARQLDPSVHHSPYLTDDGAAFSQAVAMKNTLLSSRVARLVVAEFPPPKDDPSSDVPPNDGTDPAPDPAAAPAPGAPPAPGGDPMAQPGQPAQPSTPFAPDQQSDMVVRVCPFCGSGHLIGQSDGSIKCGYDDTVFTITVMPSHPFQPLVNPDGSPFEMPKDPDADPSPQVGQASPEVTPGAGPADLTAPTPPGQAPTEPPQGGAPAGGDPGAASPVPPAGSDFDAAFAQVMAEAGAMAAPVPEDAAAPVAEDDEKKKSTPPWMKKSSQESLYVTASGERLYENAYIRHLRETVLPKH